MLEPDYFERKRRELGMDRADTLSDIQALLDRWYPGQVRARQLHLGVLRLVTPSSAVASELRMRQLELLASFPALEVKRLQITIATLS